MNFKQLVNELIEQGWRVYHTDSIPPAVMKRLDGLGKRRLLEFRVYENKPLLFVKTIFIKKEKKTDGKVQ